MSVKSEANGRRSLEVAVEVPGTPEEVWQAIATGPGISSWFVPTQFEERDGKPVAVKISFGPEMESRSEVTAWDAPRRFATESEGWMPGSPPMASEWIVEARAGGMCTVRIVQSLFASTDEWDNQLEGAASAWPAFLRTLRLYMTHFRGQRSAIMQVSTQAPGSNEESWEALTTAMGVKGLSVGDRWAGDNGPSPVSGVVEYITEDPYDALLRMDSPAPGIAALGAMTYPDGPNMVAIHFYVYGDDAASIVARETPAWQAWLDEQFTVV